MKKDKKPPRYEYVTDGHTHIKRKVRRDYDDFPYDPEYDDPDYVRTEPETTCEVLRIVPCPFQFDNPSVYSEITKPFNKTKFTCNVDVEIQLAAGCNHGEHKHEVVYEIPREQHKPGVDASEYEFDAASVICGVSYSVTHKTKVALLNNELIEDNEVKKSVEQIIDNAKGKADSIEFELEEYRRKIHQKRFSEMSKYFEKHLAKELERVVNRLALEFEMLEDRGEQRDESLNMILEEESQELRKRVPVPKGRTPIKQSRNY